MRERRAALLVGVERMMVRQLETVERVACLGVEGRVVYSPASAGKVEERILGDGEEMNQTTEGRIRTGERAAPPSAA